MRLELSSDSRVTIELRATGLLRAVGHDPVLTAAPEPMALDVPDDAALDVAVVAAFRVDGIDTPAAFDRSDRDKMRDNLRGPDVLDAARFPRVEMHGRYVGTLERGRLEGDLLLRGVRRPLRVEVRLDREGRRLVARGAWEGRLTDLGIRPFKALMGALRLDDWLRLGIEAAFDEAR